jgi:hypothetical protein
VRPDLGVGVREHGVDEDPVLPSLEGQRLGQAVHGGLGRRVVRLAAHGEKAACRAGHHHASVSLRAHDGPRCLGQEERSRDVYVELRGEHVWRLFLEVRIA